MIYTMYYKKFLKIYFLNKRKRRGESYVFFMHVHYACSLYMLLIVGVFMCARRACVYTCSLQFMCALVRIHYTFIWGNGKLGEREIRGMGV